MHIKSIHESGNKGIVVKAESSLSNGLPGIVLIGFAGKSLDESKERIKSAFSKSNIQLPRKRITVNISPSDIPKDGAHYDLAIALSILSEAKMIKPIKQNPVVIGELGLDGSIKPVRGIIGKLLSSIAKGENFFIIPEENLGQACLIKGVRILSSSNLKDLYKQLSVTDSYDFTVNTRDEHAVRNIDVELDFLDVIGQSKAKRALEIAAAGGHNVLLNGPPGVGKSMLAKAVPGIMPAPTESEIIEITHIHSLASSSITDLITVRPFRAPHHSSSDISVIGGGQNPRPGEVSLAHKGVLLLDELPEFKRQTIESLRQPLEDKVVTVARAKNTVTYPADFLLVATKNPCPCGYYGSAKTCTCSPIELQRYQKKLSGPILDRIDIHVTVDNIDHKKLLKHSVHGDSSESIRARVENARSIQLSRYSTEKTNGLMNNKDIKTYAHLDEKTKDFLDSAAEKLDISARVYMKIVKIALTIADLEGSEHINIDHIAEALQYRPLKDE